MRRGKRKAEEASSKAEKPLDPRHAVDAQHQHRRNDASLTTATSAPYGNFASYYHIRKDIWQPQRNDAEAQSLEARVRVVTQWLNRHTAIDGVNIRPIRRLLDVGCNSGEVTLEMANYLSDEPAFIMGVDVDGDLIERAKKNALRSGYQLYSERNLDNIATSQPMLGSGRATKSASYRQPRQRLQLKPPQATFTAAFWQCDWVYADVANADVAEQDALGYDLILALSVTKWIHVAHYDDGLRRFFARIASTLRADGGALVLEAQPHKSYRGLHKVTAPDSQHRRNRVAMRVMPDDIPWILTTELGLLGPYVIRDRGEDGFMRALHVYLQPATSALSVSCSARRAALLARPPVSDPLLPEHLDSIPWVPRDRTSCV